MHYGNIKTHDVADGEGVRVTLFVSGCTHHCKGCFQPETWNFDYGSLYNEETQATIIQKLAPSYISGLTLLGGEPFEPENQRVLVGLLREIKEKYPQKNVWAYSGYTFEDELLAEKGRAHCEVTDEMLSYVDVLVDGEFVEEKRNLMLAFRGSENQRIIDVPKSISANTVVEYELKTPKK